jgi:glutamine phosphoribosylpyrophosphate amidotransferase
VCGILGAYNVAAVDDQCIAAMSEAIAHRGPDAAGTWNSPDEAHRVRLGHRRLSIIDLSAAANQPFVKDGLVLVFCGEIYNYRELRSELRAAGTGFRTDSDTEVLLEAWRRWGPASLRRLRGMFTFALFDERQGTLTLARDHFGIKPLFYTAHGGASELGWGGGGRLGGHRFRHARPWDRRPACCPTSTYGPEEQPIRIGRPDPNQVNRPHTPITSRRSRSTSAGRGGRAGGGPAAG